VLGVDDWAYRKGINYGTILIDMETSRPIDILPSRESKELKEWLLKYPDVEIVTRDRSSSYSSAINEVCPEAVQVADRFHLLMNLSDALDKYFKSIRPKIRELIKDKTNEILNMPDNKGVSKEENKNSQALSEGQETIDIKVDQRQETFDKVKEFQEEGIPIKRIAKVLGISRNTVRSYFSQETLSPIKHPKSTNIDLFTRHIVARLNDKGNMIKDIIDEIYKLGYTGSRTQAYHNINIIKENFKIDTPGFAQVQQTKIPYVKPLSCTIRNDPDTHSGNIRTVIPGLSGQ
jgi:predicted transcriptional regulator